MRQPRRADAAKCLGRPVLTSRNVYLTGLSITTESRSRIKFAAPLPTQDSVGSHLTHRWRTTLSLGQAAMKKRVLVWPAAALLVIGFMAYASATRPTVCPAVGGLGGPDLEVGVHQFATAHPQGVRITLCVAGPMQPYGSHPSDDLRVQRRWAVCRRPFSPDRNHTHSDRRGHRRPHDPPAPTTRHLHAT
jgi:hypothetical protein